LKKDKGKLPKSEEKKQSGEVSRRDFLVGAGTVVVGGTIGAGILSGCGGEEVTKTVVQTTTKTVPTTVTTTVGGAGTTVTETKTVETGGGTAPWQESENTHLFCAHQLTAFDVKNGKIIRSRPYHYPDNIAEFTYTSNGKTFTLPKKTPPGPYVTGYKKRAYSPGRVLYPLKRVDWEPGGDPAKINAHNRGKSKYNRISWDEATDIITGELKRLVDKYGPETITTIQSPHGQRGLIHKDHGINDAFLNYWLTVKYGKTFTWTLGSPVSWEGSTFGSKHVWGWEVWGQEPDANLLKDTLDNCDMILHWGSDNVSKWWNKAHGMIGAYMCGVIKDWGIKQVYIQPDLNSSSQVAKYCDKWIPILPDTDVALNLGVIFTWIDEGTYDQDYLDTHSVGFDKLKDYVMGNEDGVPKTPEWASPLCGVPEWTIKALARVWAKKTTSIAHSMDGGGQKRAPYCHENARYEVYCLALQGWGRPGVHQIKGTLPIPRAAKTPRYAKGSWPAQDGAADQILKDDYGVEYSDADADRQMCCGVDFPDAILKPPISWYAGGVRTTTDVQFLKRTYPYEDNSKIHMVWSDGPGRIFQGHNCGNSYIKAFHSAEIEFFLVQHPWIDCATTMADIILPINTNYERTDVGEWASDVATSMFIERKGIEAIGESKSDLEAVWEITKKLDFFDEFSTGRDVDGWIDEFYKVSGYSELIGLEEWKEKDILTVSIDPNWQAAVPPALGFYNDPVKNPLQTPSGKIEFYSQRLADNFPDDKERPPVAKWISGGPAAEGWTHDERLGGERAKQFPLLEICSNRTWGEHNQSTDNPWIREISKILCWDGYMYEPLYIHPDDADPRGIMTGDIVKMYNDRGGVLAAAKVSQKVMPGSIRMEKGGGWDNIIMDGLNSLNRGGSNNNIAPIKGLSQNVIGLAASGWLAEVEKVTGNQMDEWRKNYPDAFKRDYDADYGPLFSGWVQEGGK